MKMNTPKKPLYMSLLVAALFVLSGCQEIVDKIKEEYDRIVNQYEEYVGKDDRGEKPFSVVYQEDESAKRVLVSAACSANQNVNAVHFNNQTEAAHTIFSKIKNLYSYPSSGVLKPFWDIRYTNPVSTYLNNGDGSHYADHSILTGLDARSGERNVITGTGVSEVDHSGVVVQSECRSGALAGGTTLNLYDAPEQHLTYAGIATTFTYQIHPDNHIRPWSSAGKGNLMVQGHFDLPIYHNYESNIGGSVSFNVFLYNPKIDKHLNYVIGIYAYGEAWQKEKAGIRFDPTTNIIHVATVVKEDSWWCTISPKSKPIQEVYNEPSASTKDDGVWNEFYRVNISYQNLLAVLNELASNPPEEVAGESFGANPADWEVIFTAVQYELEEQGGKASVSGSFRGFETYISEDAL
jgi:hypothetical protein